MHHFGLGLEQKEQYYLVIVINWSQSVSRFTFNVASIVVKIDKREAVMSKSVVDVLKRIKIKF